MIITNNPTPKLTLVVPCYNEEAIIDASAAKLIESINSMISDHLISTDSRILFVDDGSDDATWEHIKKLHRGGKVLGIRLASNRGHQSALLAGLMQARDFTDYAISLDVDLQDDITLLPEFIKKAAAGADIVFGVRSDRSSDSWTKHFTADLFYCIMRFMGVDLIANHADYRLMSRRTLDALAEYGEVNIFLRGLTVQLGFEQAKVYYIRQRAERPTRYSLPKMFNLAWDGISSFSVYPIRFISCLGLIAMGVSFLMLCYIFFSKFFGYTVRGWTFLSVLIVLFGGLQTLSIGVIGEYVAKTYLETKRRPKYFIRDKII